MVVRLGARAAFAQFAYRTRKVRITKTRIPWRVRQKAKRNAATPAEAAERNKLRRERRERKQATIGGAIKQLWALAEETAETLGDHDARYYFRELTQQARKKETQRKENLWNAFLYKETKRRIEGK